MDAPTRDGAAVAADDPMVVSESDALTLLAHLVTSAELCMVEPYDYGVFRLIDAASRLAAVMEPRAGPVTGAWLAAFRADVDERKMGSTRDRERYSAFLRDASRQVAEHLGARAPGEAPGTADDPTGGPRVG